MDSRQQALISWINAQSDFSCQQLEIVSGDASFRRYFRFDNAGTSVIAVDAPPEFEDSHRFVEVSESYLKAGLSVPKVLAVDFEQGFYCQDDFGDKQFADNLNVDNFYSRYSLALSKLPVIQQCISTESGPLPKFDLALLSNEFYLFSHWLVEVHLGLSLSENELTTMRTAFEYIQNQFLEQPQVGVHRDYHSRNLMVLDGEELGIIDFQDAVIGPITYDAVSLLRDCYQTWPDELVTEILSGFHTQHYGQHSWQEFKRWFDLTGIQRHIKASGIFARLCHRDGKSAYLNDVPRTLDYIVEIGLKYPELQNFSLLVKDKIKPAVESKFA